MEKRGSTIMQNVQQSLFHKHAERFVLYSTSHSSYFLTLAGIVYGRRKNISSKIVMVNPFKVNIMLHLAECIFVPGPTSNSDQSSSLQCCVLVFAKLMPSSVCSLNPEDYRFCGKLMWTRVLEFTKIIMTTNF
jgi:hypothetical protein